MLEAVNITKAFDGQKVLNGFSARLEKGRRYCLMGASGSGKTTLINILLGLIKPDSGSIRRAPDLKMSAVFQEDRLLEQMTAAANIALVSKAPVQEIERLLLRLGISAESLPQPVSAYSGGMKRRVALARALLADYDVLFLDEPYKGLDEETRDTVVRIVQEYTKNKTVLLITHDRSETEGYIPLALK